MSYYYLHKVSQSYYFLLSDLTHSTSYSICILGFYQQTLFDFVWVGYSYVQVAQQVSDVLDGNLLRPVA